MRNDIGLLTHFIKHVLFLSNSFSKHSRACTFFRALERYALFLDSLAYGSCGLGFVYIPVLTDHTTSSIANQPLSNFGSFATPLSPLLLSELRPSKEITPHRRQCRGLSRFCFSFRSYFYS